MPPAAQQAIRDQIRRIAEALVGSHPGTGAGGGRLRALAGHLVTFWTWRSLSRDHGLDDTEVIDLAVRLVTCEARTIAGPSSSRRQ